MKERPETTAWGKPSTRYEKFTDREGEFRERGNKRRFLGEGSAKNPAPAGGPVGRIVEASIQESCRSIQRF